jgi:carboxypeptidase Taq
LRPAFLRYHLAPKEATVSERWNALLERIHELKDLDAVLGLLTWDGETCAPPRGREGRGNHTAAIEAIKHQRLSDPALGELIAWAQAAPNLDEAQRAMVKRLARERDRAVRVPERLVKALAQARARSLVTWVQARKDDDFPSFAPRLAELVALTQERADALGAAAAEARYDVLLDEYEPEMTRAALTPVLEQLRAGLVPLVEAIASAPRPERAFLETPRYDAELQWRFTLMLLEELGFDFSRGRQDRSAHPFTGGCDLDDVRLTTRVFEDNLPSAIFSTIHECGHGLYEQGFDRRYARTHLAAAPSAGIHESQSRLWENQIGRSLPFWRRWLPRLQALFPAQLGTVTLERFHRAINFVEPSAVRVEADELTYNLHILLRYELELALIGGDLSAADLPGAWNERMRRYLGLTPAGDADGCLQDIHWADAAFGYFPTYAIGNLYAAQLMDAYERQHPSVWQDVERSDCSGLLAWLRDKVHSHGHLRSAQETVAAAVGAPLAVEPFLAYLRQKYGALYALA